MRIFLRFNHWQLFLLVLISSSCKVDGTDVINDPSKIPDTITERISALELMKPDERILTVLHKRFTKIPFLEPHEDEFLLLTNERFLRCFAYESGKGEVQEIKFENCLDIAFDSSTLPRGYIIYDISAKSIYELIYNKDEELKLLPDFKYVHYGGDITYQNDFQTLNSLVVKTWKNHHNYDSLRSLYKKFYDDNGNYRKD